MSACIYAVCMYEYVYMLHVWVSVCGVGVCLSETNYVNGYGTCMYAYIWCVCCCVCCVECIVWVGGVPVCMGAFVYVRGMYVCIWYVGECVWVDEIGARTCVCMCLRMRPHGDRY